MYKFIVVILSLCLFSCKKIDAVILTLFNKKPIEQEVVDFSQLDQFPQFSNCNAVSYQESKACFEKSVYAKINERIQYLKFTTKQDITDTLQVEFTIDKEGYFYVNKISISDSLQFYIPNLSAEIQEIISGLSPIVPAQKRGIPVTSTYKIPLVIKTKQTH